MMKRNRSSKKSIAGAFLAALMMVFGSFVGAQPPGYRIGVLTPGGDFEPVREGLRQGLAHLGYEEGKQISFIIEDTKMETLDPVKSAMRLLEAKPNLLVTVTVSHTAAAQRVTGTVPIVFAMSTEPVQFGFVAGYSSSKNNLTGISGAVAALSGKRLELLKEIAPGVKRLLAVTSVNESIAQKSFQSLIEPAKKLAVQIIRRDVTTKEELEKVLLATPKGSVDAMFIVPSLLLRSHIAVLVVKSKRDKLPFSVDNEELVKKGALVSYGEDYGLVGFQAARIVVKILNGIKPSQIPVETPERPLLALNLTTAKIIGLRVPRHVLDRVDHEVE
jgi:putative ABC transport system substrate-binding protein